MKLKSILFLSLSPSLPHWIYAIEASRNVIKLIHLNTFVWKKQIGNNCFLSEGENGMVHFDIGLESSHFAFSPSSLEDYSTDSGSSSVLKRSGEMNEFDYSITKYNSPRFNIPMQLARSSLSRFWLIFRLISCQPFDFVKQVSSLSHGNRKCQKISFSTSSDIKISFSAGECYRLSREGKSKLNDVVQHRINVLTNNNWNIGTLNDEDCSSLECNLILSVGVVEYSKMMSERERRSRKHIKIA